MVWGRSPGGPGTQPVGVLAGSFLLSEGGSGQLVQVEAELGPPRWEGEVGVAASLSVPPLLLLPLSCNEL